MTVIKRRRSGPSSSGLTISFGFVSATARGRAGAGVDAAAGGRVGGPARRGRELTATGAIATPRSAAEAGQTARDIEVPGHGEAVFAAEEVPIQWREPGALPGSSATCASVPGLAGLQPRQWRLHQRQGAVSRDAGDPPAHGRPRLRRHSGRDPRHVPALARPSRADGAARGGGRPLRGGARRRARRGPGSARPGLADAGRQPRRGTRPLRHPRFALPPAARLAAALLATRHWIEQFLPKYAADGMVLDQRAEAPAPASASPPSSTTSPGLAAREPSAGGRRRHRSRSASACSTTWPSSRRMGG